MWLLLLACAGDPADPPLDDSASGADSGAHSGADDSGGDDSGGDDSSGGDSVADDSGDDASLTRAAGAQARARWLGGAADDNAGWSVTLAGDVDGDGAPDLLVGALQAEGRRGQAYALPLDLDGDHALADAPLVLTGPEPGALFAFTALGPGDLDGDGHDDLVLPAPRRSDSADGQGAVYLLRGPRSGEVDVEAEADAVWLGGPYSNLGTGLAALPDLDGDGLPELALGAPLAPGGGAVFLVSGASDGARDLGEAALLLTGAAGNRQLGASLCALGDLDGDGITELGVGDRAAHEGEGAVHLLSTGLRGSVSAADLPTLRARGPGASLGYSMSAPGDLDGDGLDDLIVAAYTDGGAGAAFLLLGPIDGERSVAEAEATLLGEAEGDYFGHGLAALGDVDGDGAAELALGAPLSDADFERGGAVYVFHLPLSGTIEASAAPVRLTPEMPDELLGYSVTPLGDVDGDGLPEWAAGSAGHDGAGPNSGLVSVFAGAAW